MVRPATRRTAGGKSNHMLTNKTARKNIKPRLERAIKKTERREEKKHRSLEEFNTFMHERDKLEQKGLQLCEHAGGEECNGIVEFLHRTHDSDDHTIPVCKEHSCATCVPLEGEKLMEQRLKLLKQPLDTTGLALFIDDCERHAQDRGHVDVAVYGLAKEILSLRCALRTLFQFFDSDSHLMFHLKQHLAGFQVDELREILRKNDR